MRDEITELTSKLNLLIRLLALSILEGRAPVEQMVLLSRAGFAPREIAELVGTTPHTVSVTLSKMRRATKRSTAAGG
jgi:DNA-directed RNA polymerase specialized sigma24 family protein